MNYKQFSSHGSDNPHSDVSFKRMMRSYPAKRKTFGKKLDEKKKEMARKMKQGQTK